MQPGKFRVRLLCVLLFSLVLVVCHAALAQEQWQVGRIVDVKKDVTTKTLYWLVNTPVTKDEIFYTVAVQLGQNFLSGRYELSKTDGAPPEEWTRGRAVRLRVEDDQIYLRTPSGSAIKASIFKRKSAPAMQPITKSEMDELNGEVKPEQSMIGFAPAAPSQPASSPPPAAAPQDVPAAPAGVISVRSTPYLAEVYVDGNDMGYTPAKLSLPPGKHTLRFEKSGYKPWTKEITLTVGSELNVDATLENK